MSLNSGSVLLISDWGDNRLLTVDNISLRSRQEVCGPPLGTVTWIPRYYLLFYLEYRLTRLYVHVAYHTVVQGLHIPFAPLGYLW